MKHYQLYRLLRVWAKGSGHSWDPHTKNHFVTFTDVINHKPHEHRLSVYKGTPTLRCSTCGFMVSMSNETIFSESADGTCFWRSKRQILHSAIRKHLSSLPSCAFEIVQVIHKS